MVDNTEILKDKFAIINVRVFDGHTFSEPQTVVVHDGFIAEDKSGASIIDGQGGFLLPGLIDAHIHLTDENDLRQMAAYGVTTGLDMATWPLSKLNSLRGRIGMTDVRSPGLPVTCPGSIHSHILPLPKESLLKGPEDAAQFVADRFSEGADYVKVIADVPGPDQATLNAVVKEAHNKNLLVIAHASAFIPFEMAQDAKVDVVTHVPRDKPIDRSCAARMVAEGRIAVPTLTMMEGVMKPPAIGAVLRLLLKPAAFLAIIKAKQKDPHGLGQKYEHARNSVTAMYEAGVPILAGTDANSTPGSPFEVLHGESLHHELELLVEAGLSNVDALRAATCLPAKYFSLNDRGAVEVGKRADLVLLAKDPVEDIRATRSIRRVWCGGIEVQKSPLLVS